MTAAELGTAGGLFTVLAFVHFLVDWVFQTHDEALNKHHLWKWRVRHCLIYTLGFLPVLWLLGMSRSRVLASALVLFVSHFVEDTYIPVFLWAKYIRRMPQMNVTEDFKTTFQTPLGAILFLTVDQIIHLCFLWVIVALVMLP